MAEEETIRELMAKEKLVKERVDEKGEQWTKKYVGGGAHFLNWLEQYKEVYGEKNVEIEEVDSKGFSCFEKGNEKMYRIWVKEDNGRRAELSSRKKRFVRRSKENCSVG